MPQKKKRYVNTAGLEDGPTLPQEVVAASLESYDVPALLSGIVPPDVVPHDVLLVTGAFVDRASLVAVRPCAAVAALREISIERFTDGHAAAVARFCPSLCSIKIGRLTRLTDEAVATIVEALPGLKRFAAPFQTSLTSAAIDALTDGLLGLHALDASGWSIDDGALCALVEAHPHMTTLTLVGCDLVGNLTAAAIADTLAQLETLDIRGCGLLTAQGLRSLERSRYLAHNLRSLAVGRSPVYLPDVLRCVGALPNVQELRLDDLDIRAVAANGSEPQPLPSVVHLHVTGMAIPAAPQAVVCLLAPFVKLRTLSIDQCRGLSAAHFTACPAHPTLRWLYVGHDVPSQCGPEALTFALLRCPRMQAVAICPTLPYRVRAFTLLAEAAENPDLADAAVDLKYFHGTVIRATAAQYMRVDEAKILAVRYDC